MLVRNSGSPPPLQFTPQCYYSSPKKPSFDDIPKAPLTSPENPSRLASLKRLTNPPHNGSATVTRQLAGPGMPNAENHFSSALFMPIYSSVQPKSRSSSATDESGTNTPSFVSAGLPVREILYSSSASSASSESPPRPATRAIFMPSFSPIVTSNQHELRIDVGGIQGYLNWEALKYDVVDPFFNDEARSHGSTLFIDWNSSRADPHGWRAITLMKDLFQQLGYRVLVQGTPQIALSTFTTLSISIPDTAIQNNTDPSRHISYDSLCINLDEAHSLREFNWQGDLYVLATIFKGVPSTTLTTLSLTRCYITHFDAISLLHACPRLTKATLESITPHEACPRGDLMTPSSVPIAHFQSLTDLTIRSYVSLMFFFERANFPHLQSLDLDLDPVAAQDVDRLAIPWSALRKLRLHCGLTESQYRRLQSLSPRLKFKVTKVQG
ncbi:hypothetical protein BJ165DRAFT_1070633 [Panaeolus papilionaceus]|nr:hypothetical protein BJ165DRAFT_1070633 [Panaeolus papilionaceus]